MIQESCPNVTRMLSACYKNLVRMFQECCPDNARIITEKLVGEIKEYIIQFNEGIKTAFDKSSTDVDFDAGFAFASSLAKLGVVGGLGAYIAGEAAFLLGSAALISGIGGNIAIGAAVAGPIGLVVGLTILAGLGLVKLFSGGWEKSVAKKIVKSYEENNVIEKYQLGIGEYWDDTEDAFNKAARNLDDEWESYVSQLRSMVESYDIDEINNTIVSLKGLMDFFENIPL